MLDVTDPSQLSDLVDGVQAAIAGFSAPLRSIGLMLTGPSAVATENLHDLIPIVRVGLWVLPTTFPVAPQDPNYPHQLPVLTAESAASGFRQAPLVGVPELSPLAGSPPGSLAGGLALAIPATAFDVLAAAALPKIQEAASQVPTVSISSATVTCSPPSAIKPAGGTVVAVVEGNFSWPSMPISLTVTEELGFQDGAALGTMVPKVKGNFSPQPDVAAGDLFQVAFILLGMQLSPALDQISAQVSMLPSVLPFEPPRAMGLPDFPKVIFNWIEFAATTSGILGRAGLTVVPCPPGSGSLSLSGPAELECVVGEGGAYGDYTATWADLAPTSLGWQADGPNEKAAAPITPQAFPLEQQFTASFPIKGGPPGDYFFTLTIAATEVDVNRNAGTLTASARQDVMVHLRMNPGRNGSGRRKA